MPGITAATRCHRLSWRRGIGGSLLGFGYLDAAAAIIVALMVVKVGINLAWQSLRELIDTGLSTQDLGAFAGRFSRLTVSGRCICCARAALAVRRW